MRICYLSDLHIEFNNFIVLRDLKVPECDVLVVAGDLCPIDDRHFKACVDILTTKAKQVIYVAGNHEFYGQDKHYYGSMGVKVIHPDTFSKKLDYFNSLSRKGLYVASDYKRITLFGKNFHLGTMWFPDLYDTYGLYLGPTRIAKWSDFEWIAGVTPQAIDNLNQAFFKGLSQNLEPGDIVVSHHLPSMRCVNPKWVGNDSNRFFVGGEYYELLQERQPSLWIHGHTHDSIDIMIDKTRVVCNPMGYPGSIPLNWQPLVVEI